MRACDSGLLVVGFDCVGSWSDCPLAPFLGPTVATQCPGGQRGVSFAWEAS
jgi:hypothetical protein